jgi:hypothetical protein
MGRCCVAGCKSLIFILNMVVLLIGLAIMAISGYLIYQQFEYKVWSQAGAYGYVFIPLAIGFIIAMMACCSSSAAMRERKCPMVFFASLQLIFGICIVAVGAGFLVLNNSASLVATTSPGKLTDGNLEAYVSDFEVGMYDKCCRSSNSPSLKPTFCSNGATMGCIYGSVDDGYAQGYGVDEEFCSAVTDSDKLNLCSGEETSYNGLGTFQIQVASFLDTALFGSGIAFAVFGALLLVAFIGSCYIICCYRPARVTEQKPTSYTVAQV